MVHLSPTNIDDPTVTLNWSNLMALCKQCHADQHRTVRRWQVDDDGNVVARAERK